MNAVARFLRPSQRAGYEAVQTAASAIAAQLDLMWEGISKDAQKPSANLKLARRDPDEVVQLQKIAEWLGREMSIDLPLGELGDEMLNLKGECLGLALWIEGRL